MRRTLLPFLLLAAVASAAPPSARAADCPTNTFDAGSTHYASSAAVWTSLPDTLFGTPVHEGWDLVHGKLSAYTPGGIGARVVRTTDLFDASGAPAGTPVPVHVKFVVTGTALGL